MCCLRYEHEFYVQARKRFPKQGKIVQTLQGEEKVDATDIFRDLVTLRNPAGDVRVIPLAQFKRELAGDAMPVDDEPREVEDESGVEGEEGGRVEAEPRAAEVVARPTGLAQRSDSRDEPRRDERDQRDRRDARGAPNGEPRGDRPREQRPQQTAPPRDREQPSSTTQPASAPLTTSGDDRSVAPTTPQSSAADDADQRRGRRRRGRRGGRRHRGDRNAPPSNPND
jgi:hypothetical protein